MWNWLINLDPGGLEGPNRKESLGISVQGGGGWNLETPNNVVPSRPSQSRQFGMMARLFEL